MAFPNEAYDYVAKNGLVESIVRYIIDSDYRKSVYLKPWIEEQVKNPSQELLNFVDLIPSSSDPNTQMVQILKYVKSYITYKSDQKVWNMPEKWQTANVTFEKRTGDCEDGAVLMYVVARLKGIPTNRLLLVAGTVFDPMRKKDGGHCWLAYRWQPFVLTFMDWCYYYDKRSTSTRIKYYIADTKIKSPLDKNYKNMWFCFNEKATYLKFKPTAQKYP